MRFLSFFLKCAQALTKLDLDGFPGLDAHRLGSIFQSGNENNFLSGEVQHSCEDGRTFVLA